MKTTEPEFFKQYVTVVLGTLLSVMTFAFIAIPLTVDVHATRYGPAGATAAVAQTQTPLPPTRTAGRATPRGPRT